MQRPEILAPAGDRASLDAAVLAGADAVYFGLATLNARARATNFSEDALPEVMAALHRRGVKGYVTLNTLVFDRELPVLERAVRACADAGVDAVIVQDLGAMELVRAIAPDLPVHASTQTTCTDAGSVAFVAGLGAARVVVARELSLDDLRAIRAATDVELEVFVHGALCVAYSGQCLTSEAIGGRSANRGACAQACRLPYELVVDGKVVPHEGRAFLLSPEDLEASALVPALAEIGVVSFKIEGRLKGPAYVAATTHLYREALAGHALDAPRDGALATYTRGSGPGFLAGVDHQRLVDGRTCDHRGLALGTLAGLRRAGPRTLLELDLERPLRRGDGVLVEGGFGGAGEIGGRVWALEPGDVVEAPAGGRVALWLGPDVDVRPARVGGRVFRTDDPQAEKAALARIDAAPFRATLDLRCEGRPGEPLRLVAEARRDGRAAFARVELATDAALEPARGAPLGEDVLRDKLGRLGETPYALGRLEVRLEGACMIPVSSLNRARRALVEALDRASLGRHATTDVRAEQLVERARPPAARAPLGAGLTVLVRTVAQAHAALDAGATGVVLDFLELTGTGAALRALRERKSPAALFVAPPRVRKPGEEKIDRYLLGLRPDGVYVRGLGMLGEAAALGVPCVGDFSLNVTNRLSAARVLGAGLSAFTPSFDLDAAQLTELVAGELAPWAEVVVHHPMPLFHMEHCVFAAELSEGRDHRTCGRPCERHAVALRDRAGMDHPIEADVGCRNTVFHAKAQSAADLVPRLLGAGVARFRVELVREGPDDTARVVEAYRRLVAGERTPETTLASVRSERGYGVVKGSLRVIAS